MDRNIVSFACVVLLSLSMIVCSEKKGTAAAIEVPLKVFNQAITSSAPLQTIDVDETATMQITVKNNGSEPWLIKGPDGKITNSVTLGFFWIDNEGYAIYQSRAYLPNNLMPGESVSLDVMVQAPPEPGNYKLHFSMVQENVAWFHDKGAEPFVINVQVIN